VSRRTAATIRRGTVHPPVEDQDAPGTCRVCHRPLGTPNDMHGPLPLTDPAVLEAERRRLGERDTDE
jgi:hypothetical protein